MDWYRRYHGTCTDPKLEKVARRAGLPRAFAIAAWDAVLEYASAQGERGSVDGLDGEEIAIMIGCDTETGETLHETFHALHMIQDGRVAAWEKRQFDSDSSTDRVRRYRDRKRQEPSINPVKPKGYGPAEGDETLHETECNVSETDQNRTEQNRIYNILPDDSRPAEKPPRKASAKHPPTSALPKRGGKTEYPEPFETAWQAYPRRAEDGKADCYQHWRSAVNAGACPDRIADAASRASKGDFRPGMRKWLRNAAWDESAVAAAPKRRSWQPGQDQYSTEALKSEIDAARQRLVQQREMTNA